MKKLLLILIVLFCVLTYLSISNTSTKNVALSNATQQLKQRIDSAKMISYVDKAFNVQISYPDFFAVCDTFPGTARFSYLNDSVNDIKMVLFVEPNVEGWDIAEAVGHLSDSVNVCMSQGDDYFIMSGRLSESPSVLFLEKCFLIDGNWVDYTIYYNSSHEKVTGRLLDTVIKWNPKTANLTRSLII